MGKRTIATGEAKNFRRCLGANQNRLRQGNRFARDRPVKCVIPESIFTWPRGQVDARSWDAALDLVQQSLLGMAVANEVNDEEDRVLTEVFKQCEELRSRSADTSPNRSSSTSGAEMLNPDQELERFLVPRSGWHL